MASRETLEDLNLTQEEVHRLTEALKQDEFKKLFFEYAEEISNPENRECYESEIRQLENERGMDVKFVNPEPGYVMKTTIGGESKSFINVCKSDIVGKPLSEKKVGKDGRPGLSWSIPHSFTPPREDIDREKKKCQVFDFVVHPDTYRMAETNTRFKKMIEDLALDGIRKQFDVEPDTKNVKYPKMKYKGTPTPTVIRSRLPDGSPSVNEEVSDIMSKFPYPYDNVTSAEKAKQREEEYARKHSAKKKVSEKKNDTKVQEDDKEESEADSGFAVPKYTITHRSEIDYQDYAMDPDIRRKSTYPKALVVEVFLPLLTSAVPIQLDIFERQLKLVSMKPARYKLEVMLPYVVDENQGSARFDKARRKLVVTLPVVPSTTKADPLLIRNDLSGGSGDHGFQEPEGEQFVRDDADFVLNLPNQAVDRSLIEEISSTDYNDVGLQENNADMLTEEELECVNSENTVTGQETKPVRETDNCGIFSITHVLPQFECIQTFRMVRFDFHVSKVSREKVSMMALSPNVFQLKMVSVGEGGFPVHYGCYVSFDNNCNIVTNDWQLEVMKDKVVLSLTKDSESVGWWNKYSVGTDPTSLETCQFVDNSENSEGMTAFTSSELQRNGLQMDSSVPTAVCQHDGGDSGKDSKMTVDGDDSVDGTSSVTDSDVPVENSLSVAVDGEIRQLLLENSSDACDDNVTCLTELDSVTPCDTSSRRVIGESHADSFSTVTDITVTHVADADLAVSSSTLDSEINLKVEPSTVERTGDVDSDSGASDKTALESSRVLVEEIAAGTSVPPAESGTGKESNTYDGNDPPSKPNTMLSWSEPPRDVATWKTKCAIQFENSVIFDLDVE